MGKIKSVRPLTENPHVNLYFVEAENKNGRPFKYYVASRAKTVEQMKLKTGKNTPDGVIIYSLCGEKRDRVVLVRQYRCAINDYIYEFPAGLVDPGETYRQAAVRELREETGLTLHPLEVPDYLEAPRFTTIGMTDESCAMVYGYADGEIRGDLMEENEEIELVMADRAEALRILKEENVAVMCAYMLMHFIHDEEPFGFLGI